MIKTLYRYPHPNDPGLWLYVGQGSKRDRYHRTEKSSFGRRFKLIFPNTELPQPIQEEVEVSGSLELNELETIWMFRYHTWCGYKGGMNITFPGSVDYENLGLVQGRLNAASGHLNKIRTSQSCSMGGKIGGRKRVELHGNPATKDGCKKGGHTSGPINGRLAVQTGQLASIQTDENREKAGRINRESGHMKRVGQSGMGLCFRWNIKRGKSCTCGRHQ